MIAKVNIKLGGMSHQFEFENANEMEALHRAIAVSNYPTYCSICKAEYSPEEAKLTTNKDKDGNIYVNLKHNLCGGKVKLGLYKQGGYFWHREFEKYEPKENKNGENSDSSQE